MLTKELKKDFYVKLQNKRVIVLASYEVDSVAACRILINLFKTDSIQYTLVPVFTSDNIEQAFLEHNAHCNDFLFINCGATIDLLELLSPGGMINFYIIDAHRPISVTNVFSEQIHVLIRDSEPIEEIPKFDDVFRDDDEDDDEGIEEDPNAEDGESSENEGEGDENRDPETATDPSTGFSRRRKKKGFDDEKYLRLAKKQRERRQWEDKRTQILRTYEESTFFSCSSAEICYELSWLLSKDTNNLLWLAIIGLTDQYFLNRVSKSGTNYLNERDFLGSHVRRLNNWLENDSSSIVSVDCMKISSEKELRIYLYRHWTIWESFYSSLFTMSQFKLWSLKGQRKHLDFLSSIGLSLQNCKRKFKCIDTKVRTECSSKIISTYERLFRQGLKSNIWFSSFTAQYGVMNKFSALDVTIAMNALLEDPATVASSTEKFMRALDALSYTNCQMVADSIDKAKFLLQAVCEQTKNVLSTNRAVNTGQFVLVSLSSSIKDAKYFSNFNAFKLLGLYIVNCIVSSNNRLGNKSFVITAPSSSDENNTVVLGLPPLLLMEEKYSNIFGKAFETAADMTKSRIYQNYFENNYLDIRTEDLVKFLDALTTIMAS